MKDASLNRSAEPSRLFGGTYPGPIRVRYERLYPPLTLGIDNHSKAILAPHMIPSMPSVYGAVAIKTGIKGSLSAYEMLLNEGKIYNAFPRHL
jgi:hypothetical protein